MDSATASKTNGSAPAVTAFPRRDQTFPELTGPEIARMRRFGELRRYRDGEALFETGKPGPGMFVVLPAMSRSPSATASAMSRR